MEYFDGIAHIWYSFFKIAKIWNININAQVTLHNKIVEGPQMWLWEQQKQRWKYTRSKRVQIQIVLRGGGSLPTGNTGWVHLLIYKFNELVTFMVTTILPISVSMHTMYKCSHVREALFTSRNTVGVWTFIIYRLM